MSSYLVTGGAGFIGSQVAELLLTGGHRVHAVDNLSDFYSPILKQWRLDQLSRFAAFDFHQRDIEHGDRFLELARSVGPLDGVIHLAARAGVRPSVQNPLAYLQTNLLGTLNVLEVCRQVGVPKVVVASSSSVYGEHNAMPYREDADTNRPLSPYAASKKAAEELCFTYHHLYGLDISLPRFFTVYGPAGRPDMSMFRFIQAIVEGEPLTLLGDGQQVRDFSYVGDIARGVVAALRPTGYRIFNLGANHPVKLNRVIEAIEEASGRKAIILRQAADPTDVTATWADVSRASEELDWTPSTGLEEGVRIALQWYLDNREWACRLKHFSPASNDSGSIHRIPSPEAPIPISPLAA